MSKKTTPTNHVFMQKHCPGYLEAWIRDVGVPIDGIQFAYTGGAPTHPKRAVAYVSREEGYERLNVGNGKWVKR